MMDLTSRQQHVLDLLIAYQREHGFPPTNFELAGLLGCSSPNAAADHLRALEKKGAISITRGVSCGISITQLKPKNTGAVGMTLVLPFPPSVNTYWRAPNKGPLAGRHLVSADGRKFQSAACAAIIEQLRRLPKPSTEQAAVEITIYPPDARRRDLDNYNKALFDALTHAGVWEDDSQVKRMLVEWGPITPKGRVEITITPFK
ncbi:TPA: RusA family crossover junction endodeoxyribonuclease [Kluyvera cryocrescens]|nr:RusA family crossover junction endodeoxyribonuclease [Kluyvera cryocrescens]